MKMIKILESISNYNISYFGDKNIEIFGIKHIDENCSNYISFVYSDLINNYEIDPNSIIISDNEQIKNSCNLIYTDNPKFLFSKIFNMFFENKCISKSIVKSNFKCGKNCILKNCIIGNNVTIHSGVIIGEDGFGYSKNQNEIIKFPHLGKVIIEDNVEIHSNVCIDRGSLSNTIIRKNSKIDNLVHIAHNVEIGENTFIIAQSMIGGSSKIGNNCWISPGCKIIDRISIADNTILGIGSVLLRNIENSGETWAGVPAKKIK